MKDDEKFMKLAIVKAFIGIEKGQSPFGACIVKNGKAVSISNNAVKKETDSTAHAEINAIREACRKLKTYDLSGCTIYSTCEPCPMCFSACHWAKIGRIVYGAKISDAKSIGFNELSISNAEMKRLGGSRIKVEGNFMRRENLELFKSWKKRREDAY